jgi:hypothetical protein
MVTGSYGVSGKVIAQGIASNLAMAKDGLPGCPFVSRKTPLTSPAHVGAAAPGGT